MFYSKISLTIIYHTHVCLVYNVGGSGSIKQYFCMRVCALVVYVRPPPLDFECSENIGQTSEISSVNIYTTAYIYVRVYIV